MTINRIFLDLDGVLADWASAAIIACGYDPKQVLDGWPPGTYELADVLGISGNAMWRAVDARGAAFWAELEPLPWCADLMDMCQAIAPTTILTSPSKDPAAAAGKTRWLQSVFGRDFRGYLIGPDKRSCARAGAVLIDDHDGNCKAFRDAGGRAIVFPQRWNSGHAQRSEWVRDNIETEIAARPVSYVTEQLRLLAGTA
jgi:hypothetical protein